MAGILPENFSTSINLRLADIQRVTLASSLDLSKTVSLMSDSLALYAAKSLEILPPLKEVLDNAQNSCIKMAYEISRVSTANLSDLTRGMNAGLLELVRNAMPYMPDDSRAECEEVVLPQLESQGIKHLSIETIIGIISLLMTALTVIISLMPNKQLDRIIEQNDQIIEQNEQLIELQEEQVLRSDTDETEKLAYDLADAIRTLSDEVSALTEQLDDFTELPDDVDDCAKPQD